MLKPPSASSLRLNVMVVPVSASLAEAVMPTVVPLAEFSAT